MNSKNVTGKGTLRSKKKHMENSLGQRQQMNGRDQQQHDDNDEQK